MMSFAERTGVEPTSGHPQQRYLWTDAFAVCNFLGIARVTGEKHYGELALQLVDRVHHALGKHRVDDSRSGWLSGLSDDEGALHPTRAGLRIGKKLAERRTDEPFDERLEWDRDGQYFHYLTKWMHALDQVSRAAKQPRFNLWARELAEAAHKAFLFSPTGGRPRLAWKMSIDLSRPLVPSMGQLDPLDGLITCVQLRSTASMLSPKPEGPSLQDETASFGSMIEVGHFFTMDPLGLGGLLMDACRIEQLVKSEALPDDGLLCALLAAALDGLQRYAQQGDFRQAASRRLAFRELGLAIGLSAVELMDLHLQEEPKRFSHSESLPMLLETLKAYVSLGSILESFWLDRGHRTAHTWTEHRDINEAMLATSLVPEGALIL